MPPPAKTAIVEYIVFTGEQSHEREFDLIEGRTEQEVKTLLDAAHRAVLRAFEVPERDRYQIVHENKAHHMVIEDTGLGPQRRAARRDGRHPAGF